MSDERPIYLIGFMGSGKTTVAGLLAERLGWEATDTDALVEVQAQADPHLARAIEVRDLGHQAIQVQAVDFQIGRAGVLAESVDHRLHRIDLLDDRVSGAVEHQGVGRSAFESSSAACSSWLSEACGCGAR